MPRQPKPQRISAIPSLPERSKHAHKGDFGRVLVIGGSRGMVGAPSLVANAALRSGAGLVTVACPASIQLSVATLCPCATSIPLPENAQGLVDPAKAKQEFERQGIYDKTGAPSVVAAGPGLGVGGAVFRKAWHELLQAFSQRAKIPFVLDADALNAVAPLFSRGGGRAQPLLPQRTVITPHPGEMARLHDIPTENVQRDREGIAVETARRLSDTNQVTVVLKGAGTVVTDGRRLFVNKTGNPGMATGGSGDVLTGIIAALIGQGMSDFDAAVLGVHKHGSAGDLAARVLGQTSLTATDLMTHLPRVF